MRPNWTLTEEIRDYWNIRAETYDASLGHGLIDGPESAAWLDLIRHHLGDADGRRVLDAGCGTGTMSLLLDRAGFQVTGADFSAAMLDRARAKAPDTIRFLCAEATLIPEEDASFDAVVTRNLVWTLPDPAAAMAEWRRLLRPKGRLMIIDGDHARLSLIERMMPILDRVLGARVDGHSMLSDAQWLAHHAIMAQLPHGDGLRDQQVAHLLRKAGFADLRQTDLRDIIRIRHPRRMSRARLIALSQHRFALSGAVS